MPAAGPGCRGPPGAASAGGRWGRSWSVAPPPPAPPAALGGAGQTSQWPPAPRQPSPGSHQEHLIEMALLLHLAVVHEGPPGRLEPALESRNPLGRLHAEPAKPLGDLPTSLQHLGYGQPAQPGDDHAAAAQPGHWPQSLPFQDLNAALRAE